jgi:hypothetical protein
MSVLCRALFVAALPLALFAQIDDALRRQYDQIMDREHRGGRISQQERQLLMSVYPRLNPPRDSMGFTALTDLGTGTYKGEQGGLYPGGTNTMPADHLTAGLEQARQIVPLDKEGKPSPDGKIVVMSIGMSNTTMEYQTFMKLAVQEKGLNPHVVLVDGAQGGQSAVETSDPRTNFWKVVDQRLAAGNVTNNQVQAVWMFQVVVAPFRPFPQDVRRLQVLMEETLHVAHQRYPNLKIAYLSSRIYAGFAMVPQNPEPHSYESGWAPKWIIENQIFGYPEYNYDPAKGVVRFPWVTWGPYMWADGVKGRRDGVKWAREDFGGDGMHPSERARARVAKMLLDFLKTDPTAKPWFTGDGQVTPAPTPMPNRPGQPQAQGQAPPQLNARLQEIRRKVESGQELTPEERQIVQQARSARAGGNAPAALPAPAARPVQVAQAQPDVARIQAIRQKVQNGEQLTAEERQIVQQARSASAGGNAPAARPMQVAQAQPDAARIQAIRQKVQNGEQLTSEERQAVQQARSASAGGNAPAARPVQVAQAQPDAARIQAIRQKVRNGEQLTPEERQLVQQARAQGGGGGSGNAQAMEEKKRAYMKEHPPQASVGLIPLTDLGTGKYKGEEGGLYAGGKNERPAAHVEAGLKLARQIQPLGKDGNPAADGKIVFLSIGFSNPSIEFPVFIRRASEEKDLNPKMVMVNGCVGSRASSEQADPQSRYWPEVEQRLAAAGVTAKQVQALWVKQVIPGAVGFPDKARELAKNITLTLNNIHDKFPNAKVAYLSSRTYGGWTELGGSPEPGAYETGFAVKWVVTGQIAGKPELNCDAAKGTVRSPWIEWGPYLWTDGVKGRKDGLVYLREDVRDDGLHPSDKGSAKVAEMMLKFFRNDPTARIWFLK